MADCPAVWPGNGYYQCDDSEGHDGPHGWNPDRVEWVDEAWVARNRPVVKQEAKE